MARNRIGAAGDIDPKRVDVADQPKRKRKAKPRKLAPMPENLKPHVEEAERRMMTRPASPGMMVEPSPDGEGCHYTSPHDDLEAWEIQIADAFGSRSISAVKAFVYQLQALCQKSFDHDAQQWKPNELELNAALAIINSIRPENEMEAALAAQMVAVHWMQMRLSSQALRGGWIDARDAGPAGKLARTYVMQMDAMRRAKGKQTASNQTITVRQEKHVHHHQHVHLEGGGEKTEGQGYDIGGYRKCGNETFGGAAGDVGGPQMLGEDTTRHLLPMPRNAREGALQDSRREEHGSAKGRG